MFNAMTFQITFFFVFALGVVLHSTTDAQAQDKTEAAVAGITFPGTISDDQWNVFTANIAAQSDPTIALKMMIRGEAGSEENMLQALRRGRVQMAAPSLAGATSLVPELAVLQLPYLFESTAQMDWIYDEVLPLEFQKTFSERGLVFLNWIDSGWLGFYGPKAFTTPNQVAGIKLRTAPTDAARLTATMLNADVIYVPYPEIVPALQTGLIDGGITSDYGFVTGGMAEEVKVFTQTRHAYDTGMLLANAAWYFALNPHNQDLLTKAYGDAIEFRAKSRAYTAKELKGLQAKSGTRVVTLTREEQRIWRTETRPVHRALLTQLGPKAEALYQVIADAKDRFSYVEREKTHSGATPE